MGIICRPPPKVPHQATPPIPPRQRPGCPACATGQRAWALSLGDLTNADAASGLKAALGQGAPAAVALLGRPDGFLGNPQVRIGLPGYLEDAAKVMKSLGQGRHRSTIAREIRRNSGASTAYQAHIARQQACARQSGQTNAQRFDDAQWELVLSYLQLDPSPQQAAARLGLERRLRISHTCIYNRLRRMGQVAPRLRCGQRRRKAHTGAGQLRDRVGTCSGARLSRWAKPSSKCSGPIPSAATP